jgi:hypothetical protein
MSLVVALVSTLTSLFAVVHSFELLADSETRLTYSSVGGEEAQAEIPPEQRLTLVATNSGNRPAGIARGTLAIERTNRPDVELGLVAVVPVADRRVVEANKPMAVTFGLPAWDPASYGIAARTDVAFAALLCRPKRLSIVVSEYSAERTEEVAVPDRALQTLLCAAAVVAKDETPNPDFCAELAPCNEEANPS